MREPCDVVTIQLDGTPTPAHTGVYLFDLNTAQVQQLTDYVEPAALLDDSTALIIVGCMMGFGAYVVPLD